MSRRSQPTASPRTATKVTVFHEGRRDRREGNTRGQHILKYDGNATPFPLTLRSGDFGLRGVGQRLAEVWRENA